jgi:hypothetical protein
MKLFLTFLAITVLCALWSAFKIWAYRYRGPPIKRYTQAELEALGYINQANMPKPPPYYDDPPTGECCKKK